jgi:hypothetical protein
MHDLIFLPLLPFAVLFAFGVYLTSKVQSVFMKQMAMKIGFTYQAKGDVASVFGVALSAGHSRTMKDVLVGNYNDRLMRIYELSQRVGYGKHSRTELSTVFEFTLRAHVAHTALRPINSTSSKVEDSKEIALEGNFSEHFGLQITEGFDSEIRVILQPDLMHELIEKFSSYRLEIKKDHFYVITKRISNKELFLETYAHSQYLATRLIPLIESVGTKK